MPQGRVPDRQKSVVCSLLNTFDSLKFREYWFETGTPSFLVKVMRKTSYDVTRLSSDLVGSSLLSDVNTAFLNPVPLLYQSGYLTIKGFVVKSLRQGEPAATG